MKKDIQQDLHICPNCKGFHNRYERRSHQIHSQKPPIIKKLNDAEIQVGLAAHPSHDILEEVINGRSFASILYSNDDPILTYTLTELLLSTRLEAVRDSQLVKVDKKLLSTVNGKLEKNSFTVNLNGVTLNDIAQINLPLSRKDITHLNSLMRLNNFNKFFTNTDQRYAQQTALLLPTQSIARTDFLEKRRDRKFPEALRPLTQRMVSQMEFFLPFLTTPSPDDVESSMYTLTFAWMGNRFWEHLAHYLPARLGLTPASTLKIVHQTMNNWGIPFGMNKILKIMDHEIKDAYRPDALPANLNKFQHLDRPMDVAAGNYLKDRYQGLDVNVQDPGENLDILIGKLAQYKKALLGDIRGQGQEVLIPLKEHRAIEKITLTSQYTRTLMLILHLRNSGHVVLEVNGGGRVFGMPENLATDNPHLVDLISADAMTVVLNQARTQHPEIEGTPNTSMGLPVSIPKPPQRTLAQILPEEMMVKEEEIAREPKRKTRGLVDILLQKAPELPEIPLMPRRKYTVLHTREEVLGHLGKNTPEKIANQMMRDISRFEFGQKKVVWIETAENQIRFRSGDYRIILEHLAEGVFRIVKAGDRKKIYNF